MLKGGRTALIGLLLTVLGALQGFEWTTIVSNPSTAGFIISGIGALMIVLRAITDTPMFNSAPKVE